MASFVWPSDAQATCVWSDLVTDDVRVAIVKSATPRARFVQDEVRGPGCPSVDKACLGKAFVVPGDVVLIGAARGAYTCAGFVGARHAATIGFLPTAALSLLPPAAQRPGDWAGHWTAPEQDLTLTASGVGAVTVKGEATWGDGDPSRRLHGGVHTGEVAGTARPERGVLAFTMGEGRTLPYEAGAEFDCRVRMFRRGPYLVVKDNNGCGGVNVSFSGFYRRDQ